MKNVIIVLAFIIFVLNTKVFSKDLLQDNSYRYAKIAVISTTKGDIQIELMPQLSPMTVANFMNLANMGYYNDIIFHRISKNFVIQSGDPTGTGEGGGSIYGGEFKDEIDTTNQVYLNGYKTGIVAMANHGPNTNSSQFFIMLIDRPSMPRKYTIFAKVVEGMDIVKKIADEKIDPSKTNFGRTTDGKPLNNITIKRITIIEKKVKK